MRFTVVNYCAEEVARQGHDVLTRDGIERVGWMLTAWGFILAVIDRTTENAG